MDADEDLPWPDGTLIPQWWNERGSDYAPGARHLLGKPMEVESLQDGLKTQAGSDKGLLRVIRDSRCSKSERRDRQRRALPA